MASGGVNRGHVMGLPVSSTALPSDDLLEDSASCNGSEDNNRFARARDNLAQGFRQHVALGPKLSETVKGKLSLGARIIQAGGIGRVFRRSFTLEKEEKLLKACQCYLSTTAGPIAGMLFVSTGKIAFRSDCSVSLTSFDGGMTRLPYKVSIPLKRIQSASPSKNVHKPDEKYIRIATKDGFEFWFMGFVSYQKSLDCIQGAVAAQR